MTIEGHILNLPCITLKNRGHLPDKSGIYYVLDEKNIVWYIGQAKNLRVRWMGNSHHRIYQLQKQRNKNFYIYYQFVDEANLDAQEKQSIEDYHPQLNRTYIKTKKLRPTETLLRETLSLIAPYSFILGVEQPRKYNHQLINYCQTYGQNWLIQKSILSLNIIHIVVNLQELEDFYQNSRYVYKFLKQVFKKQAKYTSNWSCEVNPKYETWSRFFSMKTFPIKRILVNGFAIEIYKIDEKLMKYIPEYQNTKLAGVDIRSIDINILQNLKYTALRSHIGLKEIDQDSSYVSAQEIMKNLMPYELDCIKVFFNEEIDINKLRKQVSFAPRKIKSPVYIDSQNNLPQRLENLLIKKKYLAELLQERGISLDSYGVNKYLQHIPENENFIDNNHYRRMNVYVKAFFSESYITCHQVDKVFWLLLEKYLSDFTHTHVNDNISPGIFAPAMISVTLNGTWKTDIPFGRCDNMSYQEVTQEISQRLKKSNIPKLRFSFKGESARSLR